MNRAPIAGLVATAALSLACSHGASSLPAYGEALVVVDTDLPVPQIAGRLRVDLYDEHGVWFESRDIGRSDPADWPASFSVFSDDDHQEKQVLVRLRAYPEGVTRRYAGENNAPLPAHAEPGVPTTAAAMCANAVQLPIGGRVTLRQGGDVLTLPVTNGDCPLGVRSGSVAAHVTIAERGTYRFDVASAAPFATYATLFLRAVCDDAASQIACASEPLNSTAAATTAHFPRFDALLDPGTYYLIAAGAAPRWPADLTLEVLPLDLPLPPPSNAPDDAERVTLPRLASATPTGDATPATEPLPSATVEQLLALRLVHGMRGSVLVTLRGACLGTPAVLGADPHVPSVETARSCVGEQRALAPVVESRLDPGLGRPPTSAQGTFPPADACDSAQTNESVACVPGGIFVLGSRLQVLDVATSQYPSPERVAVMPRFWIDKNEVTVARMRAALDGGLATPPESLVRNEAPFPAGTEPTATVDDWCTYSTTPFGRENDAVSCIAWSAARAYCVAAGGDLPTEAQWEYVASAAARPFKTLFPWGDDDPSCDRAAFARGFARFGGSESCVAAGSGRSVGPQTVTRSEVQNDRPSDRSALGVLDLAGGVSEWTLDSGVSYDSDCWRATALRSPRCFEVEAPYRAVRGGSWSGTASQASGRALVPAQLPGSGLLGISPPMPQIGFRCAYATAPERR